MKFFKDVPNEAIQVTINPRKELIAVVLSLIIFAVIYNMLSYLVPVLGLVLTVVTAAGFGTYWRKRVIGWTKNTVVSQTA